jgi:hypothetical protein
MYLECSQGPLKKLDYLIRSNRLHQTVPRPITQLETLAQFTLARAHPVLFVSKLGGKIAGVAGTNPLDTRAGKMARPHMASALGAYRGRGI